MIENAKPYQAWSPEDVKMLLEGKLGEVCVVQWPDTAFAQPKNRQFVIYVKSEDSATHVFTHYPKEHRLPLAMRMFDPSDKMQTGPKNCIGLEFSTDATRRATQIESLIEYLPTLKQHIDDPATPKDKGRVGQHPATTVSRKTIVTTPLGHKINAKMPVERFAMNEWLYSQDRITDDEYSQSLIDIMPHQDLLFFTYIIKNGKLQYASSEEKKR